MLPEPSLVLSAPQAVGAELPWSPGVSPLCRLLRARASPGWALQGWAAPAHWREDVLDQTSQTQLLYLQDFDFCGVTLSLCEVSSPRQAPSTVVWLFGTCPSPNPPVQTHPGLLMCPAGAASASPPALFFRPPFACSLLLLLCAKSVQCWLCQVNFFQFAVGVAGMGLCMDTPRGLGRASVQTPHHSRPFGRGRMGEGALFGCRAGIFRAGIIFYKKKVSKEPPARGAGGWMFVAFL